MSLLLISYISLTLFLEKKISRFNYTKCIQNRKYTQLKILYQLLKKIKKESSIIVPYIIESSTTELNDLENSSENIEIYISFAFISFVIIRIIICCFVLFKKKKLLYI